VLTPAQTVRLADDLQAIRDHWARVSAKWSRVPLPLGEVDLLPPVLAAWRGSALGRPPGPGDTVEGNCDLLLAGFDQATASGNIDRIAQVVGGAARRLRRPPL
jgi:hypothetical protein